MDFCFPNNPPCHSGRGQNSSFFQTKTDSTNSARGVTGSNPLKNKWLISLYPLGRFSVNKTYEISTNPKILHWKWVKQSRNTCHRTYTILYSWVGFALKMVGQKKHVLFSKWRLSGDDFQESFVQMAPTHHEIPLEK